MIQGLRTVRTSFLNKRFLSTIKSSKLYPTAAACVADINDNSTLLVGGFGLCGIPEFLIDALREKGSK